MTLVERVTRRGLVGRVPAKGGGGVKDGVVRLLSGLGIPCGSIPFDNGKESAGHAGMAPALGAEVFFARPYHSWERGANEDMNGLIRRLFPKGVSFGHITEEDLARIGVFLNDRPKKCLGWKTPREVMAAFLAEAA